MDFLSVVLGSILGVGVVFVMECEWLRLGGEIGVSRIVSNYYIGY